MFPTGLVGGRYYHAYDAYYQLVDPTNKGTVEGMEGAAFLKKSGLPDSVLVKVWDMADLHGKGYLTKSGFFTALKCIALYLAGKELCPENLILEMPPPDMSGQAAQNGVLKNASVTPPTVLNTSDWAMKPNERMKYEKLFDSLQPENGVIPGNKVKGLLMDSKLSVETLGKIWDLADMDEDGALNKHEFCVAMHLVYKALEKYAIPSVLPPELLPPGSRKSSVSSLPGAIPVLPVIPNGARSGTPDLVVAPSPSPTPLIPSIAPLRPTPVSSLTSHTTVNSSSDKPWVVSAEEKAKADILFAQADLDKDGYVSGQEIKDTFLQSGVPQHILAHIWTLCDTEEEGKLNSEQFALAMWLISRKLKGIDPPLILTPEMVPPSCRNSLSFMDKKVFCSLEVDALMEKVEKVSRERTWLENNVLSTKADIKIRTGEANSLQGELDALVATLKQLETQKGEAQKRLADLRRQTDELELELSECGNRLGTESSEVEKLRQQADEQDILLRSHESELKRKKREWEDLNTEEQILLAKHRDLEKEVELIKKTADESTQKLAEMKAKAIEVRDFRRSLETAVKNLELVKLTGDLGKLEESSMNVRPMFKDSDWNYYCTNFSIHFRHSMLDEMFPPDGKPAETKTDPFAATSDPFVPSARTNTAADSDPFMPGGKADPFNDEARALSPGGTASQNDQDPFGCDPFAILHAPPKVSSTATTPTSPRSESPSPALPPKKSKQPPPRPAPPRPAPPVVSSTPSPSSFDDFADFSNFSSKVVSSTSSSSAYGTSHYGAPKNDFRDRRYEDPFAISDESVKAQDPFSSKACNGLKSSPIPPEDQQLAWATAESARMEEERRKKAEQEKADLKLALKLSKQNKKKSFRSKILS